MLVKKDGTEGTIGSEHGEIEPDENGIYDVPFELGETLVRIHGFTEVIPGEPVEESVDDSDEELTIDELRSIAAEATARADALEADAKAADEAKAAEEKKAADAGQEEAAKKAAETKAAEEPKETAAQKKKREADEAKAAE